MTAKAPLAARPHVALKPAFAVNRWPSAHGRTETVATVRFRMALSTLPQACQSGSKKRKICLPWTKPPPRARTLRSEVVRRWAPTAPCN